MEGGRENVAKGVVKREYRIDSCGLMLVCTCVMNGEAVALSKKGCQVEVEICIVYYGGNSEEDGRRESRKRGSVRVGTQ